MESSRSRKSTQKLGENENILTCEHQLDEATSTEFSHESISANHAQECVQSEKPDWQEIILERQQEKGNAIELDFPTRSTYEFVVTGGCVGLDQNVLGNSVSYVQGVPSGTSYWPGTNLRSQQMENAAVPNVFPLDETNEIEVGGSNARLEENVFNLPSSATTSHSQEPALTEQVPFSYCEPKSCERDLINEQQGKNDAEEYVSPSDETNQFKLTGNIARSEENLKLSLVSTFVSPQHHPSTSHSFSESRSMNFQDPLNANSCYEGKEKRHECGECKKVFPFRSALKVHQRMHTGEKPYECEICKKRFSLNSNLKRHLLIHSESKSYECGMCSKTFRDNWHLKRHQNIHSKEKLFECKMCKRIFKDKSYFNRHILTHTGERPFECDICHQKFTRENFLKEHLYAYMD